MTTFIEIFQIEDELEKFRIKVIIAVNDKVTMAAKALLPERNYGDIEYEKYRCCIPQATNKDSAFM